MINASPSASSTSWPAPHNGSGFDAVSRMNDPPVVGFRPGLEAERMSGAHA